GSLLINTGRGGLVDEQALVDSLRSGHLGGAGFDVLTAEPPAAGNPLLADDLPNLVVTPHTAWGSREARQRIVGQLAENLLPGTGPGAGPPGRLARRVAVGNPAAAPVTERPPSPRGVM